jgi:hypothetical protein
VGIDPSETIFEDDSAGDGFGEGLVDSDKAGHEVASITGLVISATPFDAGLFQAGFFALPALPFLLSELSIAAQSFDCSSIELIDSASPLTVSDFGDDDFSLL